MRVKEGEDIGASGSSDQTIKIWSLKDGRLLNTIYTHSVRERREEEGWEGGRGRGSFYCVIPYSKGQHNYYKCTSYISSIFSTSVLHVLLLC